MYATDLPLRLRAAPGLAAASLLFVRRAQRAAPALLIGLLGAACTPAVAAEAQDPAAERWRADFQTTYIGQFKPGFPAAYSGVNSLSAQAETSYSWTGTGFLGLRLAQGTELYFNPEVVRGVPLSRLTGLGGLTNGELQKTAGPDFTFYRARLFVRQTWGLGGARETVEPAPNQLGGSRDAHRLVLTIGNLAASDLFDLNAVSHDARTQLLNWSFLTHGAYDFAADSRGYSWGAALEYFFGAGWAVRAGRFAMPKQSNGLALDFRLGRHYGDQIELEKNYSVAGKPGALRLLAFRNVARMGGFDDALAYAAAASDRTPSLEPVRGERSKIGFGIALQQAVSKDAAVFARLARSDGRAETYAFAEIDQSASAGLRLGGARWNRPLDAFTVGQAINGLSGPHRAFLAAGGSGFFLGDGRLSYAREQISEAIYSIAVRLPGLKASSLALGFQFIRNPGYNADRGPVRVGSVRLHAEF